MFPCVPYLFPVPRLEQVAERVAETGQEILAFEEPAAADELAAR